MTEQIKLKFGTLNAVVGFFVNAKLDGQSFRALRRLVNKIEKEQAQSSEDQRAEVARLGATVNEQGAVDWSGVEDKQNEFVDFKQKLLDSEIGFNESYSGQFDTLRHLINNYTSEITPQIRDGFMALEDALEMEGN